MTKNIDFEKVRIGFIAVIFGLAAAYFGQPLVHSNDQAINVLVTVFSVLAGFLVAIIAIVGDPVLLPPGTWRAAEMDRERIKKRLIRYKLMFMLYLATLGIIFLTLLLYKKYEQITPFFEYAFLFCGAIAFLLSLRLPHTLMQVQKERIDAVIEARRNSEGIQS